MLHICIRRFDVMGTVAKFLETKHGLCDKRLAPTTTQVSVRRWTHQVGGVAGGEGEDVGAGDGGVAGRLDLGLDGVDDLVPAHGVGVGPGALLAGEGRRVVEQDGAVTPLATKQAKASASTSALPTFRCGAVRWWHTATPEQLAI